jgi:hypothetical protein
MQVIEIVLRPRSIEIRFNRRRARIGRVARALLDWSQRCLRAWREDRQALLLAQLDERTLRDIGLDCGSGSSLAARGHAYRQQELRRMAMAQLGLM